MSVGRTTLSIILAASLTACGGGGSSPTPTATAPTPTPTPTASPTPTPVAGCSLSERQDWALAELDTYYLFPTLLDTSVNKNAYSTVNDYIDALVAPARAESKDRFFTYVTSIAEENAFFNSGSSAGFGVRLAYDTAANRVFVIEAYEGAPAIGQNIDRGTELLAIGTSSGNLETVSSLMAAGGPFGVIDALGDSTVGVQRVLRVEDVSGAEREVTVTKADYALDPVSDRYGVEILDDGGKKVGYINLRTFIDTAEDDLIAAIGELNAEGVTEVILDFRYNGGGLVSVADLIGDLLGANQRGNVWSRTTFRDSLSQFNEERDFQNVSGTTNEIGITKLAVIGTGSTASASELVTNAFIPYLGNNLALVGTNTFGKPVGQIARDEADCDDRLRVVAFKTENADGQGEYFTGLASVTPNTCRATDDIFTPLGDPNESSISAALDFLGGRSCTPITASSDGLSTQSVTAGREILQPHRPSAAQREVPGLF